MNSGIRSSLIIIAFIIIGIIMWKFSSTNTTQEPQIPSSQTGGSYIDYDPATLSSLSGDIVLFFHADRCSTCQQAQKNFLASGIPAGLTIVKVNYDKETELKKKYAILTQTSFVYVKNDGSLIKRRVGGLTIDDVVDNITQTKGNNTTTPQRTPSNEIAKAYLAGGCFRCMEGPFESLPGVKEVISGYIGGDERNANYEKVSLGATKHREAVEIIYDPALITYGELLQTYRRQIDPTDAGGQFADRGYQYTTAIYYSNDTEKKQALANKQQLEDSKKFDTPIVVQILPVSVFYPAEDYHQDYYKNNAANYKRYKKGSGREDYITDTRTNSPLENQAIIIQDPWSKTPTQIQSAIDNLSSLQQEILFEGGTERPFDNEYRDHRASGIYVDVIDGTPLFSSTDKFDSDTGRPAFSKPIDESLVDNTIDTTAGMIRTEIKSSSSNGHLGHVFDDGPADQGGQRYCINSAALKFIPLQEMENMGYGKYLSLFQN